MYCEFVRCAFTVSHTQEKSNIRWHKKIIIIKINFKLQIELIMKTVKNIVINIDSKFMIITRDHQSCESTAYRAISYHVTMTRLVFSSRPKIHH